jgi:hypothetical protein
VGEGEEWERGRGGGVGAQRVSAPIREIGKSQKIIVFQKWYKLLLRFLLLFVSLVAMDFCMGDNFLQSIDLGELL